MDHSRPRRPSTDSPYFGPFHYYVEIKLSRSFCHKIGIRVCNFNVETRTCTSAVLGYAYLVNGEFANAIDGTSNNYGPVLKSGDTVGIHFDLISGTIEFHVNDISLGIAARNINRNGIYYLTDDSTFNFFDNSDVVKATKFDDTLQFRIVKVLLASQSHEQVLTTVPPGLKRLVQSLHFLSLCRGEEPIPDRFPRVDRAQYSPRFFY